jgi:hypothetical protein
MRDFEAASARPLCAARPHWPCRGFSAGRCIPVIAHTIYWKVWTMGRPGASRRRIRDRAARETLMISKCVVAVIAALGLATPAFAEDTAPPNDGGRYIFNKVADGFLRLDTQTGEVSVCSPRAVGWACLAAPEDRTALENQIARLRNENAALKKDILSRGLPLPAGAAPEAPAAGDGQPTVRLPSDADVDRVVAFVGRVWHRFVEAIARAQKQVLNKS